MTDDQTEKKYAVLSGNVSDGFTLYGPFDLRESDSFCSSTSGHTMVMTLHPDPDVPVKPVTRKPADLLEQEKEAIRNAARWLSAVESSLPPGTVARGEVFSLVNALYSIMDSPRQ